MRLASTPSPFHSAARDSPNWSVPTAVKYPVRAPQRAAAIIAFDVSPPKPGLNGAPSSGWLSSTSASPMARMSAMASARCDRNRDAGHDAGGGAMGDPDCAPRTQQRAGAIGGERVGGDRSRKDERAGRSDFRENRRRHRVEIDEKRHDRKEEHDHFGIAERQRQRARKGAPSERGARRRRPALEPRGGSRHS